jgi:serine/threonine protein kinase
MTRWLWLGSYCRCGIPKLTAADPATTAIPAADLNESDQLAVANLDDKYEILGVLGRGGMGAVYKARHKFLDKVFAVKVLNPQLISNASSLKRFKQEAQAASRLTHPNLVAVYDFGTGKTGHPFLVMDCLEGKSLGELLAEEGFLEPSRTIDLFVQVCEAVSHAHEKGIVHRDIKPNNIIITKREGNDFVKIVDFGIAKLLPNEAKVTQELTQTGEIFGSPLYMSPEQCQGLKLDARSDIYSIGCVMYETLCGKPPISGANPLQTLIMHLNVKPVPFSQLDHDYAIPADLESVVSTCLEKDPADRYQTVEDLRMDLANIRDGISAKPRARVRRARFRSTTSKVLWILTAVIGISAAGLWAAATIVARTSAPPPIQATGNPYTDAQRLDQLSYHYFSHGDYERAIPLLEFGIKTYQENGRKLGRGGEDNYLADNYQHIGKCYLMLKKYDQAAPYYRRALAIYQKLGKSRAQLMAEAVQDYAEVLRQLGRSTEATALEDEFATTGNVKLVP